MNDSDWLDDLALQDLSEQLANDDYERWLYENGELFADDFSPNFGVQNEPI